MSFQLASRGAANEELARTVHDAWMSAAIAAGVNLAGFDPASPLAERVDWARGAGLDVATIYSRSSSRYPQPVAEQVLECVTFAAGHRMYSPPELVSVDQGIPGSRRRLEGLVRLKGILSHRVAEVLLIRQFSGTFRSLLFGYILIDERVEKAGLWAVSVTDGIDTSDYMKWRVWGLMASMRCRACQRFRW